jgi:hypothetical protein
MKHIADNIRSIREAYGITQTAEVVRKEEMENCLDEKLDIARERYEEIKEPLTTVLEFVERWNKQDKEKEVADAAAKLFAILMEDYEEIPQFKGTKEQLDKL